MESKEYILTKQVLEKDIYNKLTLNELSKKHNVCTDTIRFYLKKYNIKIYKKCKYCNDDKDLKMSKRKNGIMLIYNICNTCWSKKKKESWVKIKEDEEKFINLKNKIRKGVLKTYLDTPKEIIDLRVKKNILSRIKNGTLDKYKCSFTKTTQKLFTLLENKLKDNNIKYEEFKYGKYEGSIVKFEKRIDVSNISNCCLSRFLDCYIKINNREINFEFDEEYHKKNLKSDLIREKEILEILPNLEIYRIDEDLYRKDKLNVINDLFFIILGNFNTKYEYDNLNKNVILQKIKLFYFFS